MKIEEARTLYVEKKIEPIFQQIRNAAINGDKDILYVIKEYPQETSDFLINKGYRVEKINQISCRVSGWAK